MKINIRKAEKKEFRLKQMSVNKCLFNWIKPKNHSNEIWMLPALASYWGAESKWQRFKDKWASRRTLGIQWSVQWGFQEDEGSRYVFRRCFHFRTGGRNSATIPWFRLTHLNSYGVFHSPEQFTNSSKGHNNEEPNENIKTRELRVPCQATFWCQERIEHFK